VEGNFLLHKIAVFVVPQLDLSDRFGVRFFQNAQLGNTVVSTQSVDLNFCNVVVVELHFKVLGIAYEV
jgi:hypothetical protein